MGYTDRREVKQFQFTAWPDHGVPEHSAPFLQFIRRWASVDHGGNEENGDDDSGDDDDDDSNDDDYVDGDGDDVITL